MHWIGPDPTLRPPLDEAGLSTAQIAWVALGLIDRDDRLTDAGAWVLPRAPTRAWGVDFDAEPGND